jgi:spore coat protein U-like protein
MTMTSKHFKLLAIVAVGNLVPVAAMAANATTTFQVTATVNAACSVSATDMAFGVYTGAAAVDQTSSLSVTCTLLTPYTIALDAGAHASGVFANRAMNNGTDNLNYQLYTNVGRTTIWGDGSSGTSTVAGSGLGVAQPITVYGRIPASQNVSTGSYVDNPVNVTLTY